MSVTDDELRTLIREAVARHLGPKLPSRMPPGTLAPGLPVSTSSHASHYQYVTLVNVGDACVIEPAVTCTHCGYCRCHGH